MKRILASFLAAAMIFGGAASVYGAAVKDVEGTPYEEVVSKLMAKKVLTGYKDETFRPERTINRAEACIIVVRAMGATSEDLKGAVDSEFTDLAGYYWAAEYINYAAEYGIVSGYGNAIFKPGEEVTVAEMVVMLTRACGISDSEIDGRWPTGFMNKARELGMMDGLQPEGGVKAESEATRGNVALMTAAVADKIEAAHVVKLAERPQEEMVVHKPLTRQEAAAYAAVVEQALERYGEGGVIYNPGSDIHYSLSGLFGVFLIDLDNDGKDELLLAYGNGRNMNTYQYDAYRLEGNKAVSWMNQEAAPRYEDKSYVFLLRKSGGRVHVKLNSRYERYAALESGEMIIAFEGGGGQGEVPVLNGEPVAEDVLQDAIQGYFETSRSVSFTARESGRAGSYSNSHVKSNKEMQGKDVLKFSEDTIAYLKRAAEGKATEKDESLNIFAN